MIVILSYHGDQVANAVMDWLYVYKCKYKRINLEDEDFRELSTSICTVGRHIQLGLANGEILKLNEVSIFFFRGGLLKLRLKDYMHPDLPDTLIETHLMHEFNTLVNFFYKEIAKKCLGNPMLHPLNKLEQLQYAVDAGLMIPDTIINSSKKQLNESKLKEKPIVTKSIQENSFYQESQTIHYDLKVNHLDADTIEEFFFPSLFQENIEKSLEIRAFYLDGAFYSLAMLRGANDKQVVDYRMATETIRYAKYQLPKSVELKLKHFMKGIGLNTGSIDLLLARNGEYYFLEVNPTGQIGWVSEYGNYFIEEKIAKYLLQKEIQFTK